VFVRSIFAHATVKHREFEEAWRCRASAIYTSADLALPTSGRRVGRGPAGTSISASSARSLASERFRYVGEPYGVVIAETRRRAQDAAERSGPTSSRRFR
jgi:CO/xanthine dehydrogenase Mo-binding subunit